MISRTRFARLECSAAFSISTDLIYHHYDGSGHGLMLTDIWANITEQYQYDAFGKPYFYSSTAQLLNSSPFGNRFLFTGREWLKEVAVYDFRNRVYQPELGRFLQPDPKQFAAGDYNLYRYCHNDPVNKSDPFGLVNLSYTPSGAAFANEREWEKTYNPKGWFSIAGHGDDRGPLSLTGSVIPVSQIVKDMMARGYKAGTPVAEIVCEAGKGGENSQAAKLAKALANETGQKTTVAASTTELGAYRPGALPTVLPEKKPDYKTRTGDDRYDKSKPGKMQNYTAEPDEKRGR